MYLKAKGKAKLRQDLEAKIVVTVIDEALKQGYSIAVENGDNHTSPSIMKDTILQYVMETDEDSLIFYKDNKQVGWVDFVYGNDGFDVMHDWSANSETNSILKPALEIVNQY